MTIKEVVKQAKYIQFPYNNESYKTDYDEKNPVKLPIIPGENVLYTDMPKGNGHHYTYKYTYDYVMPAISKLLGFKYSKDDFNLIETFNGEYDLSYLRPKEKETYTVICYETGEVVRGNFGALMDPVFFEEPLYREIYRFPHSCSRIVNHTTKSERKLMVSGDSQMIPAIPVLAHYFKEVWYFDNRTGYGIDKKTGRHVFNEKKFKSYRNRYRPIIFTDVLVSFYCRSLDWYEYWNLQ